jgi:hypothetical protein
MKLILELKLFFVERAGELHVNILRRRNRLQGPKWARPSLTLWRPGATVHKHIHSNLELKLCVHVSRYVNYMCAKFHNFTKLLNMIVFMVSQVRGIPFVGKFRVCSDSQNPIVFCF